MPEINLRVAQTSMWMPRILQKFISCLYVGSSGLQKNCPGEEIMQARDG